MNIIKIFQDPNATNYFMIDWMLHDKCTYDCSYCPPANKSGTDSWLNLEKLNQFCDLLETHVYSINPNCKIQVLFTGGEPTVWRGFGELVNRVSERGWLITVNSNGSRSKAWWEEYAQKFDRIILSYHTESVDDDEFIEKLKICEQYAKTSVNLMLNTDPTYFYKVVEFSKRIKLETSKVSFTHYKIQHTFGLQKIDVPLYTSEQKEIVKSLKDHYPEINYLQRNGRQYTQIEESLRMQYEDETVVDLDAIKLLNNGQVNFKDWKCYAGMEGIFIDAKGNILKATCRADGPIGNVMDPDNIKWPDQPVTCPHSWCGCVTDIKIGKQNA